MAQPTPEPRMDVRTTPARTYHRWAGYRHWIPVPLRRTLAGILVVLVASVGAVIGLSLGSRTPVELGPFHAEMRVTPTTTGETEVEIPPLGALHLDTHDGPTRLTIALGALDQARTQQIITDPGGITRAAESVPQDVLGGVVRTGLGSLGAAVLGAMLLTGLVFRDVRRTAWAGGLALVLVGGSLTAAAATLRLDALEEPRYEGLLVNAPALIGDVQRIADDYQRYTEQLQQLVGNVSTLYTATSSLPTMVPGEDGIRVLHVSDLHLNPAAWSIIRTVVEQYGIDVIIDSGDIVDWGTGPEAEYLNSIRLMGVPYVYVRGNHDSALTQEAVAEQPNAVVLDDQIAEVAGLTIAGIGDPRFTPDQRTKPFDEGERGTIQQQVVESGATLAERIRQYGQPVQIAVVHDPSAAPPLSGTVPLVLSGHQHERRVEPLPAAGGQVAVDLPTLLMVQGSSGGAGLRGLEGEYPEPLALSVLYFDDELGLIAYDDITIGGHGLSEAAVQRHVVDQAQDPEPTPSPTPTATAAPD